MLFQDFDRGELILSSDCEIFIGASVVEMERLGNYGQLINAVAASPLLPLVLAQQSHASGQGLSFRHAGKTGKDTSQ